MSKTWEHYQGAAHHHEEAGYQLKKAAKYHETEDHERAAHHAYLAHGHAQHAVLHQVAAAKLNVERWDGLATPGPGLTADKKTAA
jgi:hypothetical protein